MYPDSGPDIASTLQSYGVRVRVRVRVRPDIAPTLQSCDGKVPKKNHIMAC